MRRARRSRSIVVVVGAGGVGKTTLAAALGMRSARAGRDTLVMTFDPSARLKQALQVGEIARQRPVDVPAGAAGRLAASLLDARLTFDRLVARYAPDDAARDRILRSRFYDHLSGTLAGVLEYMAVERLYEVAAEGEFDAIVLDTPPTRQALDFLEAPSRLVGFLDSGALRIALKPWFDAGGRLRVTSRLGVLGRGVEGLLDRLVGLDVLRDMAEFFQAFGPLYEGFRTRATEVEALLRRRETTFLLVGGPGEEKVPDTMFFARHLVESGYRLGPVVVNRVHPPVAEPDGGAGVELLRWLAGRDRAGIALLADRLAPERTPVSVPLLPDEPTDLDRLGQLAELLDAVGLPLAP